MQLPRDKLIAVYEQVFLELLEAGEKDLAKEVYTVGLALPRMVIMRDIFCRF